MSRIPDSFIQEVLSRSDIVEIIGARVELKRAGREYRGLSPFTNEKSPSFFVSPAKQMFFDFSSGRNGTAITFLMDYDRLSFVEAVEDLAGRLGLEVPRDGSGPKLVLDGPLDALSAAERFFKEQLKKDPAAKAYLLQRGVQSDTARRFGIGFAPESWDALTKVFPDPRHALDAGLLIAREGGGAYDRFRNRLMFPIRDSRGRAIGFGGRTLGNDPAKYLNSPETPLFHKGRNLYGLYEAKQASKTALPYLVVVEGYMDVVMLAQHGITEAVATLGTATTPEHLQLLFKNTQTVIFCFDGDRAGRAAAQRALEHALSAVEGPRACRFLFLPDGHDPDSYVQEIGATAFRGLLDSALPLVEFLLQELIKQVDLSTLDGRARLAELARPALTKLKAGPLRSLLVDELARLTRLKPERIEALASAVEPRVDLPSKLIARLPTDAASKLPRRALRLLLEDPALAVQVQHRDQLASLSHAAAKALVEAVEFFDEHRGQAAASLIEHWRGTPKGEAVLRLLQEPVEVEGAALEKEFQQCLLLLRDQVLEQAFLQLTTQTEALSPADRARLQAIQAERKALRAV